MHKLKKTTSLYGNLNQPIKVDFNYIKFKLPQKESSFKKKIALKHSKQFFGTFFFLSVIEAEPPQSETWQFVNSRCNYIVHKLMLKSINANIPKLIYR